MVKKINITRQGPGRTTYTDAVICNLHYKDFKGPSKENKDLIPVHFKRPSSSNPAVTPAITPPTASKRKRSAVVEKITKKSKCMSTDEDLYEHVTATEYHSEDAHEINPDAAHGDFSSGDGDELHDGNGVESSSAGLHTTNLDIEPEHTHMGDDIENSNTEL